MVTTQNGAVSGQVIETVHDDGDHDVQHDEAAQEDEGDVVAVGDVIAARLIGVDRQICSFVYMKG